MLCQDDDEAGEEKMLVRRKVTMKEARPKRERGIEWKN